MNRSLIIVAHGSSVKPDTATTVMLAALQLGARRDIIAEFDRVAACFLKQEPLLSDEQWDADESVVIPFFMSDGYFVREVLPRHLPPHARVTAPLGASDLSAVVRDCVLRIDAGAHLVLVGHGTERDPNSSATVEAVATALRRELRSVTTAFVDQAPRLETTWARVPPDGGAVVVVPYFAFAGPHTEDDIPRGLRLPDAGPGPHAIAGHAVFYATPIGTAPAVIDLLARLALQR